MSRRKTKALLKTLYTGLLIPAVQQLATGVTITPDAMYYLTLADATAAINGGLLLAVATAAVLVHEYFHELELNDEEIAMLRKATAKVSEHQR